MSWDSFVSPSKGKWGIILTVETDSEITIKQFADEILKLTGSKSEIVYRPLPPDDPKQRKPNIALAQKLLGWEPKIGREEGMKRTLDYFRTKV